MQIFHNRAEQRNKLDALDILDEALINLFWVIFFDALHVLHDILPVVLSEPAP